MRGHDFKTALIWARKTVERFDRLSVDDPAYRCQLHSAQIALAALLLCQQHGMEGVVLGRLEKPA